MPRREIPYWGGLPEMDLDAVLARHPQLAVIDELAHTNAPGSRHPKRGQDKVGAKQNGDDDSGDVVKSHLESSIPTSILDAVFRPPSDNARSSGPV